MAADLNDKASLLNVENVLKTDERITVLVNNAGVGAVASILTANVDEMESMINLNITALVRLTYAAAPAFVARGAGTIINIASAVGIAAEVLNGVYSASKAFVIAFGHSLQKDLADRGVRVQTVAPAATRDRILGRPPAMRRKRRRRSPCRRKTWSMPPWPASIKASL